MDTTMLARITRDNVAQAAHDAYTRTTDARWRSAIAKATQVLQRGEWLFDGTHLQIVGSRGFAYTVTPQTCECIAFERGIPCYHRAAATILTYAARLPVLESKVERMVKVSPAEAAIEMDNERATDADFDAWRDVQPAGVWYRDQWYSNEQITRAQAARDAAPTNRDGSPRSRVVAIAADVQAAVDELFD